MNGPCQCGELTGVPCYADTADVTLETIPVHLRDSHVTAGNSGTYPLNGAHRLRVSRDCACDLVDGNWTTVVSR